MLDDKTTINIVTACDNAYAQHTAVFLKSLFANHPNDNCRVFVLVPDNFVHRASLERNIYPHSRFLEFLNVKMSNVASFKVSGHVSVASYYRLFLDTLMPTDVNRAIYLDADVLITGSLKDLWAVDLDKYIVAAVTDPFINEDQSVRQKIRLAPTSNYFNAGVLVIDFSRWRNAKLGERALKFAAEYPELLTWNDQCALNHILNGQFRELTKDWNFQTCHLWREHNGKPSLDALRELEDAKIIHFTGESKPWFYLTDHPKKWLYWQYLRQTEWNDYYPPDRNGFNILRKNLENKTPALVNAARRARKFWRPIVD